MLSSVGLWGLVGAAAWWANGVFVLVLLGVASLLALREYLTMVAGGLDRPARTAVFGTSIVYLVGVSAAIYEDADRASGSGGVGFAPEIAGLVVLVTLLFAVEMRRPLRGRETLSSITAGLFGFVLIPVFFSFVARVAFSKGVADDGSVAGISLVIYLLAATKFTDMGAYLVGTMIGKHKMIPHISPGKTWQGFGGALLGAAVASVGLVALFPAAMAPVGLVHAVVLALVLGVVAVFGDLVESVVKRCLGAKDSGQILPGIGGAFDLIDSLCFTAPVFYLYLHFAARL